ncbi:LysR family transcriptional regulator [Microtetraspora fusca]|uniref:LysR family transcriptional regulator n=1 Tax=Microtetraspora fusca TaxID=1997 RepID=UPI0009FE09B1|nr:LysR family transcriptional regulator [Microtetraspora fusca]
MSHTGPGPTIPELPLQALECFSVLAHQLHFGRTAETLGISQGRVSQLIKRLEIRVGAPVFERTSRRVELTAVGRALADEVVPAFRRLHEGFDAARASALATDRPMRVGFQCAVYEPVARAIAGLPEGATQLVELSWGDPFTHLIRGEIDVAIVLAPCREKGLHPMLEFSRQPMFLAVSGTHRLARGSHVSGSELSDLELIEPLGPAPDYWRQVNAPKKTRGGHELTYSAGAGTIQEALSTVASSRLGLLLCEASTRYVPRPDIRYLPAPDLEPTTLLVLRSERKQHGLADRFAELLVKNLR